jgi:RNA recognition motif-containing protein
MKIYVGNLSWDSTEADLTELFGKHGSVSSTNIITNRTTGRNRGFAFVEMANASEGAVAIKALHETSFGGRNIIVNEARPMEDRPRQPRY